MIVGILFIAANTIIMYCCHLDETNIINIIKILLSMVLITIMSFIPKLLLK